MSSLLFSEEDARKAGEEVERRQREKDLAKAQSLALARAREDVPDRAEALKIERTQGIPFDTAERNLPEINQNQKARSLALQSERSEGTADLLTSPAGPLISIDPQQAGEIQSATQSIWRPPVTFAEWAGASLDRGSEIRDMGVLAGRVGIMDIGTDAERRRLEYALNNPAAVPQIDMPSGFGWADDLASELISQGPIMLGIGTYAAAGAATGAALGAPFAGVGALPGAGIGGGGGVFTASWLIEGGGVWMDLTRQAREIEQQTGEVIDPLVIRGASAVAGAASASLEVFGLGFLARFVPGYSRLKAKLVGEAAEVAFANPGVRARLKQIGKWMAGSAGTEAATEAGQTLVQKLAVDSVVAAQTNQTFSWGWEDLSEVAWAATVGAVGGPAFTATTGVALAPANAYFERQYANKRAEGLSAAVEQSMGELGKKLRETNPDIYKQWHDRLIEEAGGDPNLYIDATKFNELLQSEDVDAEALAQAMPEVFEQLDEALVLNAPLVIPVSEYLTYLPEHHEALADDIKFALSGTTRSESSDEEIEAQFNATMDELSDVDRGTEDLSPGEVIEQQFLERLIRTGAASPDVARRMASLLRTFVERLEGRGVGEEAFNFGLDVEGPLSEELRPTLEEALERIDLNSLLDELRSGAEPELRGLPKYPLLSRLREFGVQIDSELAGELRHAGLTQNMLPGIFQTQGRYASIGSLIEALGEEGSDTFNMLMAHGIDREAFQAGGVELDAQQILDAIVEELQGRPLRTEEQIEAIQARRQPREELAAVLDQLGLDLDKLTNEDIISTLMERYGPAPTTLEQADVPETVAQRNLRENEEAAANVEGRSTSTENKHGLMPHLRVPSTVPEGRDKPLFAQTTTNPNAPRQIAALSEVLERHPNATDSPENWAAMMADALASDDIPVPPYAFIQNINSNGAVELLSSLTEGQKEDADHGFETGKAFREAYINGEISVEDTGRLFFWSFLSKGVSPYRQESLFIDAFDGIDEWIKAAHDGTFLERQKEFLKWSKKVAPKGSGQPGAGASHNLNAFGKTFLIRMAEDAGDGSGRSRLELIHDMMSDPNSTGPEIRRKFQEMGEGVGIDNKVVSFTLLVAGFTDVLVLDRVQTREMWNDGRFGSLNLYDGYKVNGRTVTGSGLNNLLTGARGLLVYEALERGLLAKIDKIYSDLGRPEDASVGRYHWETWVTSSGQEASHATIDAVLSQAKGEATPLEGVTAKEGEYSTFYYGARYGVDGDGTPYFLYSVPGIADYRFTLENFPTFVDQIKKPKNGVVPTNFKVTEVENAPWFLREEVNLENLANVADQYGERYEAEQVSEPDARAGIDKAIPNRLATDQPDASEQEEAEEVVGPTTLEQAEDASYRGQHTAPEASYGAPMHAMDQMYPDDIYSSDGARFYGDGINQARNETIHNLLLEVRGNPDAIVTVYRGVPAGVGGEINPGDWVTTDKQYAEEHAARYGEFEVQEKQVRAGDLYTEGNSLYEFGWSPAPATTDLPFHVRLVTSFSGAGTVEAALRGVQSVGASEFKPEIIEQYNKAHGTNYSAQDVSEVDPADIAALNPQVYHASPVCKNFSKAKRLAEADDLDLKSAESVAAIITEAEPPVVTVENVPDYADTALFKLITDALDEAGYTWDVVIHDAADYGAAQTRKRMLLRAVREGELPALPKKTAPGDWFETVKDLLEDAPDSKMVGKQGDLHWELERLGKMAEKGQIDLNKPIITMGGSTQKDRAWAKNAGGVAPTLKATDREVPRIILPDGSGTLPDGANPGGRIKKVTPRMMARLMGLPDSYPVPDAHKLAKTVLGNGVHGAVTRNLIQPLIDRTGPARVLEQEQGTQKVVRGSIRPATQGVDILQAIQRPEMLDIVMRFTKAKNLSTGLHEMGHLFFVMMLRAVEQGNADAGLVEDMQTAMAFLGVDSIEAIGKEQHETWARAWEAYLYEGKAPSSELQSLFQRFRAWMIQVYKTIKKLDVELTPEIREVFDRMLATDEQIEAVRNQERMAPAFTTPHTGVMTAAEFKALQEAYDRSQGQANEKLLKAVMAELRRELTEEWKANRKKMREQVEVDINLQPVYQLRHYLQHRTLLNEEDPDDFVALRLDKKALVSTYGKSILKALGGSGAYSMWQAEGGLHPDQLAKMFNFSSGDALVRALQASEGRKEAIEKETDRRMKETYGDILNDGTIVEMAQDVMESDAKGNYLLRELRILSRASGKPDTPQSVAKQIAKRQIQNKRIREIRPHVYRQAEEKAARAMLQAVEEENWEAAHAAGLQRLLNHFLLVEANKAREQMEKGRAYALTFNKKTTQERIGKAGEGYLDEILSLLHRFDFRRMSDKEADRRQARLLHTRPSLQQWIEDLEAEDETATVVIDQRLRDEGFATPWRNLRVDEFQAVIDAVKNIEHLARLKNKLLLAKEKRELAQRVEEAVETIGKNARKSGPIEKETRRIEERIKQIPGHYFASHRKLASLLAEMDGEYGGVFFDLVLRTMDDRGTFETVEREKAWSALSEIFAPFSDYGSNVRRTLTAATLGKVPMFQGNLERKEFVPGLGEELSLQGRIVAVLNMGNAGNKQRLLDGYGWTEQQAQAIVDSLTKEEFQFVQNLLDLVNSYQKMSFDKQQRVTGVRPEAVEATPIRHSQHGEIKGGYFPIAGDTLQDDKQSVINATKDAAKATMRGAAVRSTTKNGHLQARAEAVKGTKIRLDLGVVFEHIDNVIHDVAWHEWLIDTNKLFSAPEVREAIFAGFGEPVYAQISSALQDIAAGDVPAQKGYEQALDYIRQGSSIAGMGWNVVTGAIQPIGLTQSMVRIGPKWVAKGLSRWLRGAANMEATVQWIYEMSPMMKNRGVTMQREIREVQQKALRGGAMDPVKDSYFFFIVKMQQVVDIPTWLGAYEKEMAASGDESRAVAMADRAVVDAQGGGNVQDLAKIQRGGPLMKMWTNFYSFFNTTLNLTAESYRRTDFTSPKDVGKFAVDMLLLHTVPLVLSKLMGDAIRGSWDEDETWAEYIGWAHVSWFNALFVGPRELSGAVEGYFGYSGPSGARGFNAMSTFIGQMKQGEADRALMESMIDTAGILLHWPTVFINRAIEGSEALIEGTSTSPHVLFTGPPKKD